MRRNSKKNGAVKRILCLVLALAMVVLAGCSNGTSSTGGDGTATEGGSSQSAAQNSTAEANGTGDLKVVRTRTGAEPDSLDPFQSAASDTEAIMHNVFEGLVLYDETGAIIPGLAESWEISEDGLTYTFHLRDDVNFHNGQHMTADDVIYTYQQLSGLESGGEAISSKFTDITNLEAPDEYTVVITLGAVNASFLQLTKVAVVPKDYTDQATAPIGTGPFKFVEYTPGQRIVLEKNEDYYEESRMPQIDRAEIYIMTDESAVVQALQSGELDFAGVSGDNAMILEGQFDIYSNPQNMVQIFALNNEVEPFDDVRVRQAISCAVNKQEIIDGAFDGYATELYSNFSPVMGFYYNDELTDVYTYDVARAQELLNEAGYGDGFDMTITVPANYQAHIDTAQIIAEQLKAVNINAEIELIEWGAWLEDVYGNAQYQTTIVGLTGKLDPNDVLVRYTSDYSRNFFRYNNPEYDELIEKAMTETDENVRAQYYKECQRILTEDAAAVWTCDPNIIVACRPDLKGYTAYPVTFTDLSKLYYEE